MSTASPSRSAAPSRKSIHQACLHNLELYLQGEISFAEWRGRQEELESRLSPEPELPFTEDDSDKPGRTRAA